MTRIPPPLPVVLSGPVSGQGGGQSAALPVTNATGALARLQAGTIIEGSVVGRDAGGATLLRTPQGTLSLPLFPPPPQGSTVTVELQSLGTQMRATVLSIRMPAGQPAVPGQPAGAPPAGTPLSGAPSAGAQPAGAQPAGAGPAGAQSGAAPAAPAPAAPAPAPAATPTVPSAFGLSQDWPALRAALDVLAGANPQAAQSVQTLLPGPNAALPAALLLFMNALGRGDLRGILGRDAERALRGSGDLLSRLSADFNEIARVAAEPRPDGFRLFLIPFYDGARLEQIRLLIREHEEERHTAGASSEPATRFVFDITLSRLGHLQLDGLAGEARLDLMIRSTQPLPRELRAGIAALFADSRSALGLRGDVAFLVTRDFPVDPAAGLAQPEPPPTGLVV